LREKEDDPRVRQQTALAHKKVADILRLLGRHEGAAAAYREAIDLLGRLAADRPDEPEYRDQLADGHNWHGELLRTTSRPHDAMRAFARAGELLEGLTREFPGEVRYRKDLARCYYNRGIVFKEINQ